MSAPAGSGNPPRPALALRPAARGVTLAEALDMISGASDLSAAPMGAILGKSGPVLERLKRRRPALTNAVRGRP